jgi:hypothetical protein
MKTHSHYTTPIAAAPWVGRASALLALLALAAAVALAFALARASQPIHTTTSGATARPAHSLIASCRACADEVLGAAQAAKSSLSAQLTAPRSARQRVASSRVFQDEVLGADQLNMTALAAPSGAFPQPMDDLRRAGPR